MSQSSNATAIRPTTIEPYPTSAPSRVMITQGKTKVLCTTSIADDVPPWLIDEATGEARHGWVTAENAILPGSTPQRKKPGPDRRGTEIQRLIGRALRASVHLNKMRCLLFTCDCDVIAADGGTRTASITSAFVSLSPAIGVARTNGLLADDPIVGPLTALSVGIVKGDPVLDLDYELDAAADVDMNVAMNHEGNFVELQATAEQGAMSRTQLDQLLDLAAKGITDLTEIQRSTLATQSKREASC